MYRWENVLIESDKFNNEKKGDILCMNLNRFSMVGFYLGFAVFLILTGGGYATFKGLKRQIAGALDAEFVGPEGEIILFYKEGNLITIKECAYTFLYEPRHREDCKQKPGTYKAQLSATEFKNRLNAVLRLPVGNYTSLMKQKIEAYNKWQEQQPRVADLKRQRSEAITYRRKASFVGKYVKRIKDFVDKYVKQNVDLETKKAQLEAQLAGIEQEPAPNRSLIIEVNQAIEDFIHKVVDSRSLTQFVYSQDETSFEFNILKSYVEHSGISMATFAPVKAGTFLMGSPSDEEGRHDDELQRMVTLTQNFEIQTTEVTQIQYFLVMGYNPSFFGNEIYCSNEHQVINREGFCPEHPVELVSWDEVQDFISQLNKGEDGYTYRLPTEAQWEYAARGCVGSGEPTDMASCTMTAFNLGDNISPDQVNYNARSTHKNGPKGGYRRHTVKVSSLANANRLGLYDMHGNVFEWVEDRYGAYSKYDVVDPKGGVLGSKRVLRSGSWFSEARFVRSANRRRGPADRRRGPADRYGEVGFRLVRTAK